MDFVLNAKRLMVRFATSKRKVSPVFWNMAKIDKTMKSFVIYEKIWRTGWNRRFRSTTNAERTIPTKGVWAKLSCKRKHQAEVNFPIFLSVIKLFLKINFVWTFLIVTRVWYKRNDKNKLKYMLIIYFTYPSIIIQSSLSWLSTPHYKKT